MSNVELDSMIHQIIDSTDYFTVPDHVVEMTIQKLNKRILFQHLIMDLLYKLGLVLVCLSVFTGVYIWSKGLNYLDEIYKYFLTYGQIISEILILIVITIIIDQVILKFYTQSGKVAG